MKDLPLDPDLSAACQHRCWYQWSRGQAIGVVFALGCVLGLMAWLGRAIEAAREAARRSQCICNFCGIALALQNYHEIYGSFPPAHVDDAEGRPMHSWRVLILPYLEQQELYNKYNFGEPWDSPGNSKLLGLMPNGFACPSRRDTSRARTKLTSYVAVTGPGTVFPDGKTVKRSDIKDGTASTLMLVEVADVDIPWTEPRDLDIRAMSLRVNDPNRAGISSRHPGGANVSFADGSKRFLGQGITPGELKSLLTIDGGEKVDVDRVSSRH